MRSYRDHYELVHLIRELGELLDRQSKTMLQLARERGIAERLIANSALPITQPQLQAAFQMLIQHAGSLEKELIALGASD